MSAVVSMLEGMIPIQTQLVKPNWIEFTQNATSVVYFGIKIQYRYLTEQKKAGQYPQEAFQFSALPRFSQLLKQIPVSRSSGKDLGSLVELVLHPHSIVFTASTWKCSLDGPRSHKLQGHSDVL
ncbi:hypothetical protein L1987_70665 [Smallanthus sonchifolius]|uniref:Uncharacterized protein n=1 Tax=Smallanthus sonchifolius TaxID=185202 RepID=A0ACB9AQ77_9ASTR|nr:hypothetical protein L1987_70665 [Smallanthus sonchifolius]